jgi:hypothetical protein
MTISTQQYADDLRVCFNFNRYATLIHGLGNQLNSRKDRFDKSDIIEQCVDVYSNGRLRWVDLEGRDHIDQNTNYSLEFKYLHNGLYTGAGKEKPVVKVKIKNSLGKNKGIQIDNPADYYIIAQQDAMSIISWNDIRGCLTAVADGIEASIPRHSLSWIFCPRDVQLGTVPEFNYKFLKGQAQRSLIESVVV